MGSGTSACPSKANAEGIGVPGNQSCRACGRGLRAGRRTPARDPGWKEAPGACLGGWPRREQVVRRLRLQPHCSNFPAARQANRALNAREAGRERAVRGSWYRVRVRSGASPRLGLCSPPDRPPRAACSGADHRRVSLPVRRLRLIGGAPAAPGSPWAVRSPVAACWLQLQAREARSKRPEALSPRAPCPGLDRPAPPGSATGRRRTRFLAEHRARSPRSVLPSCCRSSARSTFPRSLRPARPPPPRPRLLTLLPSPPASPRPRPPGRAFAAHPPIGWATRIPASPPGTPAHPWERRGAWPGAQGMNISVLAKLPSADVMAPAAVVTRRILQRAKEEARGSGPRCVLEPCPAGPPAVPERGTQSGGGPANLPTASRLWQIGKRSREAEASEPKRGLGEAAPSVGFKRPLSALRAAVSSGARSLWLVLGAAWPRFSQT